MSTDKILNALQWVGFRLTAWIVPLLLLALWNHAAERKWIAEQLLPSPLLVASSFKELWESGELQQNLFISLRRIGQALAIGGSLGLAIGFALGLSRTMRIYLRPTFEIVSQFPVIGWIPLLIIFLGMGEALKVTAIVFAVFVPFAVNTSRGMAQLPGNLLEVARVYRFSKTQGFFQVVIPAALPNLFTGLRQGVMQAWLSLVFVELLASSDGLGYLMVWGRQLLQMDLVVLGIVVIGVIGLIIESGLTLLERRLLGWRRSWV